MRSLITLLGFTLFTYTHALSAALALTGKVTDAQTKEPLIGAVVSIPELQLSVTTNAKGEYNLAKTPLKGRFVVEVRYIGYQTASKIVDFASASVIDFALRASTIEIHEVVVTGTLSSADNRTNSTSVASLNKAELLSRPSGNVIDAISRIPGVSQITTGAAVSKPVIRGLSYNRVITLSNGVKQEGQQWGDEHGIEIDQYSAGRIEVLRGAASLIYGSDALGGVINLIDPLPPSEGSIKGEIITNHATNNGLTGNSAMLEGNQNGLVWRARGTYKNAFAYNTPEGRIANSAFNETDYSGLIGFNKTWGYSHLNFSRFQTNIGIPGHNHEEEVTDPAEHGREFFEGTKSRTPDLPFQDVRHYKVSLNNHILLNKGRLRTILAFQNNQRRELESSRNDPSLFFDLKTYSYDFKYYFPEKNGWEPIIGISGAFQNSKNKAEELLIPDYSNRDFGAFAYLKRSWEKSTINAGLRFDYRNFAGKAMQEDGELKFSDFSNQFSNVSGALGFTHNINEKLNFKANIGSAFRAPNIAELSSNGVHEGTFRYEIGNTDLKPERSFYTDAALEYHSHRADIHLSIYNNYIGNYIYSRQLANETIQAEGESFPVFRYVQDNANLYGFEAGLTLHPTSVIHLENSFALTRGINTATQKALPYIPAGILRNELRLEPELKSNTFKTVWLATGIDNYLKQSEIDPGFETITGAYSLLNASVGASVNLSGQLLRFSISGNNLLDKEYVNHLNRLKPLGILDQGRNISFNVYLPFLIKKGR